MINQQHYHYSPFGVPFGVTSTWNNSLIPGAWHSVFIHEFGHTFGGLTDEHANHSGFLEIYANTTRASDANVKWMHWAGHRNVSPTPRRFANGWAVPGYSCVMGTFSVGSQNSDFCGVCAAELTRRMAFISGETFIGRSPRTYYPLPNTPIVAIPEGTARILDSAFHGNASLNTITIPASVAVIGDFAFIGATGLDTIINHSTIPQQINYTTFAGVDRANVYLHVPTGTEQAYIDAGWTGFRRVIGTTPPLPIQHNRVFASSNGSFAIMPDNSLWSWGDNSWGQLGDGSMVAWRTTPVQVMKDVEQSLPVDSTQWL